MRVLAMSALACTLVTGLSATAEARSLHDRLRSCLELKDMTKQRLDCYDAILPPQANPMPLPAKVVTDCRFSKDENERLTCFNQFAENRPSQWRQRRHLPRLSRRNRSSRQYRLRRLQVLRARGKDQRRCRLSDLVSPSVRLARASARRFDSAHARAHEQPLSRRQPSAASIGFIWAMRRPASRNESPPSVL